MDAFDDLEPFYACEGGGGGKAVVEESFQCERLAVGAREAGGGDEADEST